MKTKICVVGLGYVGLPLILNLSQKFECIGFDVSKNRIMNLKIKKDTNKEFKPQNFEKKKIIFTSQINEIKKCNFYIVCVPTPITRNKKPDLNKLNLAIKTISKVLKKGDIIFIESTIYPGLTENYKNFLEKKTNLKHDRDFFIGYSPERVNPGDKINTLKNINKIVSINTTKKNILSKVFKIYGIVSKKIIFSKNIKSAETAKVIENIQRDLNIALMNEILLICKKLNINFKEVIRLAETKWNFLKFNPGLVGGHCLPVDPYYLSSAALKNKFKTLVTLSGRKINETMFNFVIDELKQFLKKKKKTIKSSNILIIGLSYKAGIADMRNSINFKIFNYLFKNKVNVQGFDPYVEESIKTKYQLIEKINKKNNYSVILFLSKHNRFHKEYKKLNKKFNKSKILDPFEYYK
jgi:UDP-N-acetyl-D-galactosamine dehydrogenase